MCAEASFNISVIQQDSTLSWCGAKPLLYNLNVLNHMKHEDMRRQIHFSQLKTVFYKNPALLLHTSPSEIQLLVKNQWPSTVYGLSSSSMSSPSPCDRTVQWSTASMGRIYVHNHPVWKCQPPLPQFLCWCWHLAWYQMGVCYSTSHQRQHTVLLYSGSEMCWMIWYGPSFILSIVTNLFNAVWETDRISPSA